MAVADFVLWPDATVTAAAAAGRSALAAWGQAWGIDSRVELVACLPAADAAAGSATDTVWRAPQPWHGMRFAWTDDWTNALHGILFSCDLAGAGPLSTDATNNAQEQLIAALGEVFCGPHERADFHAGAGLRGSGALVLTLRLGQASLRCLLGATAVAARFPLAPPDPLPPLPKISLAHVFHAIDVTVRVNAGAVALRLDQLASLAPGDVLRLDRSIDLPLEVSLKDGKQICHGYLGLSGDRVGIELVP